MKIKQCLVGTWLCGIVAITGCGASTTELKPANETPKVNQVDVQKQIEESQKKMLEMSGKSGDESFAPPTEKAKADIPALDEKKK